MNTLSEFAEHWMDFMVYRSLDFVLAFGFIGFVWFFIRRRVSSQFGYLLFLILIIKLAIPPTFSLLDNFPIMNDAPTKLGSPVNFNGSFLDGAADESNSGDITVPKRETITVVESTVQVSIPLILLSLWGVGILLFGIRLFWIEWKSHFMIINTILLNPTDIPIDLNSLQKQMSIKRPVRWVTGDWVKTPMVYGVFQPVIAVPKQMDKHFSQQQLRFILLHELAHIQRWDGLVSFVQNITRVLFFFHPLVWWVNSIIDQQREYACDDTALRWSNAPRKECGEGFFGMVVQVNNLPTLAPATLGLIHYKTFIKRRLLRILDQTRTLERLSFTAMTVLLMLCVSVSLFGFQAIAQGLQWTKLTPATQPPPRIQFGMVYDSQRDRIVLHGGSWGELTSNGIVDETTLSDTWEYDGSEWHLVSQDGPPIIAHGMAYDPIHGETVLFGGVVPTGLKNKYKFKDETWLWDGSTWTNATASFGPSARANVAMTFDPDSQSVVMNGGNLGTKTGNQDTWSWDGSNWSQLATEGSYNYANGITYDENRQKLIMLIHDMHYDEILEQQVAGTTFSVWEWDNNQWIQTNEDTIQSNPLPPRVYSNTIFLPFMEKVLFYGGGSPQRYLFPKDKIPDDDFWTWDGENWEQVELSPKPLKRMGHKGVYDSKRDRFVTFGGITVQDGQAYYLENMWALSMQEDSVIASRLWR